MALANTFYKPDKEFLLQIGSKVREIRKSKGLTIEAVAERCQLHAKYIQGFETGKRNISISAFRELLKGLDTSLSDFF